MLHLSNINESYVFWVTGYTNLIIRFVSILNCVKAGNCYTYNCCEWCISKALVYYVINLKFWQIIWIVTVSLKLQQIHFQMEFQPRMSISVLFFVGSFVWIPSVYLLVCKDVYFVLTVWKNMCLSHWNKIPARYEFSSNIIIYFVTCVLNFQA
jgi:hypothetical protein